MTSDDFTKLFREEHRKVRDLLLDLVSAFTERDRTRIHALLGETARSTGPHFRYEEEALYPALVEIFGQNYIDHLFREHDRAIGAAQRLIELAAKDPISDGDAAEAVRLVRGILPHVSDCDGLSIMVERLPRGKVDRILDARDRSLSLGLDLLGWVAKVRSRPAGLPA